MNSLFRVAILDTQFEDVVYIPNVEEEVLAGIATVEVLGALNSEQVPDRVQDFDAILCWHHITNIDQKLISRMKQAKILVRIGMGFDNVDIKYAGERNIQVCNVPDYGVEEVADSTLCLLLCMMRRTYALANATKEGKWGTKEAFGATRLNGRTLGLVGLGRIGMAVALRAKAFSLNVVFYDPYVEYGRAKALGITQATSLDHLLEVSDILSIHCPLVHNGKSNKHLINKENISRIKRGAFFVNTARGAIVEEEALVTALKDGTIQQAAVDVFEKEPYTAGPLLDLPNVILTPHCSFYSDQGVVEMRMKAALEVKRLLTGENTLYCVNRQFLPNHT